MATLGEVVVVVVVGSGGGSTGDLKNLKSGDDVSSSDLRRFWALGAAAASRREGHDGSDGEGVSERRGDHMGASL
jgi:hypothetical protein